VYSRDTGRGNSREGGSGRQTGAQDQPAARRRPPPWPLTWARLAQVEDGGCDNKDADLVVFAGDVLVYPVATTA